MCAILRKIDPVVKQETIYIAVWVIVLSIVMQAVFWAVDFFHPDFAWDYTVLLGNLLSAVAAIGNFFLLGMTVQNAVTKDEKDARNYIKFSQTTRFFGQLAVALIGLLVPCFHPLAVIIPLLFPRVAIMFRPLFKKD